VRYRRKDGTNAATAAIPTRHASPPDTTEVSKPRLATVPDSRSPSRGPPATTTMNTPCMRPCISSGAACCRIVERNTALTMSAAPAAASSSTPTHSVVVRPNAVIATPQATIASSTARPCRLTRPNQPPPSAPIRAPAATAA
jgi:hypothetical protein